MKVKYNGYKYNVRFWHGMRYCLLSISLYIKRTFRRLKKVTAFVLPSILILPVWTAFFLILMIIEKQSFIYYVDQCKYSIFSSVVIAAIVRLQSECSEYKKNLRTQHEKYVSLMHDTESLVDYIFECAKARPIEIPRRSLYTLERYRKMNDALKNISGLAAISETKLKHLVSLVVDDINALISLNNRGALQISGEMDYQLDRTVRKIKELQSELAEHTVDLSTVNDTIGELFFVIDELRYPWRRDDFVNKTRRMIIAVNNPNPDDRGHYFNLFEVI